MRNIFIPMLLLISVLWNCDVDQKSIKYGSNQGKNVSIHGKMIYYEEYGKGMPLLLLSGGGIMHSIKDYEKCLPTLAQHYRVIAADTPGQGRSEQPDTVSYSLIADAMALLIDSLHLDSVYVMGWSDGGIVGILLAEQKADKVKRVIAVGANNGLRGANIPPGIPIDSIKPFKIAEFERLNRDAIESYSKTVPGGNWRKAFHDLNAMWYTREYFPTSVYGRINIPVMIVLGDRDDVSIEHGLEMHRSINNSQFCILPNTTHAVFDERPELINNIAINFFVKAEKELP